MDAASLAARVQCANAVRLQGDEMATLIAAIEDLPASATHEDAELKFNGWVCETYTHPRVPARSNCYRYSDKNRANIADYLKYNSN